MATRSDIYTAIQNADKAGDSDSVRQLGDYLKTMPDDASPVPMPKPNATTTVHPGGYGALDLAGSKFTWGLADKVAALGATAGAMTNDFVHGRPVRDFGPSYDAAAASEAAQRAAYAKANPKTDWATSPLNFIGGGTAATGIANVARAAVASGGVGGAAQALGAPHPTALSVMSGAIGGGLLGRVAPVVVPKVLGLLGGAGRAIGSAMPASVKTAAANAADYLAPRAPAEANAAASAASEAMPAQAGPDTAPAPQQPAATPVPDAPDAIPSPGLGGLATSPTATRAQAYIGDRLYADGTDPATLTANMIAAHQRGQPYAPMDSGPAMQRAAASIARKSGPGSKIITDAVGARQLGQGERIQQAIRRDLGPTTGVEMASKKLDESAAANAGPLYTEAYAHGGVDDPVINALAKHPEMQSAIDAGKQIHADESFIANAKGEEPPPPLPTEGFDVRSLDYTKRALGRKIDSAYAGDSAAKMQLPMLQDLQKTLLGRLDNIVPQYAAARAAYAGPKQSAEALQMGQAAVKKSGNQIEADTYKMGESQLDQYRLGHRSAMSDLIDNKVDGADKVRAIISAPARRKALEQLYGGEQGLANLHLSLADEAAMAATHQRVTGNSKTAENTLDDADLSGFADTAHSAFHLAKGNPFPAVAQGWSKLSDKLSGEAGQRLRAQVAGMLSENNPALIHDAFAAAHARNLARGLLAAKVAAPAGAAAGQAAGGLLNIGRN